MNRTIGEEFMAENKVGRLTAYQFLCREANSIKVLLESEHCTRFEDFEALAPNLFAMRLLKISLKTRLF